MVFNYHNKVVMYCLIGAVFVLTLLLLLIIRNKNARLLVGDSVVEYQEVAGNNVNTVRTNINTNINNQTMTPERPSDYLPSISYDEALIKYKNSRIQFNEKCQAIPSSVTYKNNTYVMLDNRAPFPQVVNIDNSYALEGGGFQIMKLSSDFLPMTWHINCGNQKNVGTILLQQ